MLPVYRYQIWRVHILIGWLVPCALEVTVMLRRLGSLCLLVICIQIQSQDYVIGVGNMSTYYILWVRNIRFKSSIFTFRPPGLNMGASNPRGASQWTRNSHSCWTGCQRSWFCCLGMKSFFILISENINIVPDMHILLFPHLLHRYGFSSERVVIIRNDTSAHGLQLGKRWTWRDSSIKSYTKLKLEKPTETRSEWWWMFNWFYRSALLIMLLE